MKTPREYAREYLGEYLTELGVGRTVNVEAELVHEAYGEFDINRLGMEGTSIRPWANSRPDLRVEPDPHQCTVKITRLK